MTMGTCSIFDLGTMEMRRRFESSFEKKSGANSAGTQVVGKITQDQVKEIAEAKMKDLNAVDIEGAMRIIEGSARSMGVQVVEG